MLVHFDIDLVGQTLALERVLCAVRRRAFEIRSLRFRSRVDRGVAQIVFAIETDEREAERLEASLWKLHEVRGVKRTSPRIRGLVPIAAGLQGFDPTSQRACRSV